MKVGGSKRKGSGFEKTVCRLYSIWWSKGIDKQVFWRVGSSGAVSTISNFKQMSGDVVQVNLDYPELPFSIECKCYKDFRLECLLDNKKNENLIFTWLKQCVTDAKRANKMPMLVMKRNFHSELLVIPSYVYDCKVCEIDIPFINFWYNGEEYSIMKLKEFFRIDPDLFKDVLHQ